MPLFNPGAQPSSVIPLRPNQNGSIGSSLAYARGDHQHPPQDNVVGRNLIINGAFDVDQRSAGGVVTFTPTPTYTLDRWVLVSSIAASTITAQRVASVFPGSEWAYRLDCSSGGAIASGQRALLQQRLEGYALAPLMWGTPNAQPATISFWARSNKTGMFAFSLRGGTPESSYIGTFTITAANTPQYFVVPITRETSAVWFVNNTNQGNLSFNFSCSSTLTAPSANAWHVGSFLTVAGAQQWETTGDYLEITQVQFEVGTVASPFEVLFRSDVLARCRRYFALSTQAQGRFVAANDFYTTGQFTTAMRATPTIALGPANFITEWGVAVRTISSINSASMNTNGYFAQLVTTGGSSGNSGDVFFNALQFSAEL